MAKKILSSQTLGSSSTNTSSYSSVTNKATSNAKSWNTSKVSNKIKNALKNAEKSYSSPYEDYLNKVAGDIQNRKDFNYDVNKDALYQQYAKQYKALGNQAMQETMANASALTGGYGSSYATTAGQQAFNNYMQQLNDIVPDLYAQARTNYDTETSNLYNEANLYAGLDSEAYNRWNENRNYYLTKYDNEWNRNAVSHSSQVDKSSQIEKSGSSSNSSSSSTNYVNSKAASGSGNDSSKNAISEITANDYKYYQNASEWLGNNGLGEYIDDMYNWDTFINEYKSDKEFRKKYNPNSADSTDYQDKAYSKYLQEYLQRAAGQR